MATSGRTAKRQLTWVLQMQDNDASQKGSGGSLLRFRSKPPRQLRCPFCRADFGLSDAARSYVCLCGRVLRTDPSSTTPLVEVACTVCASQWGAHADAGAMTCHGCGTNMMLANGVASPGARDAACSKCAVPISSGAYFCRACGALQTKPYLDAGPISPSSPLSQTEAATLLDYTDDALAGDRPAGFSRAAMTANTPVGHFVHACWLAELTRREVLEARSSGAAINYFRFMRLLGRIDHAVACLALAIDSDERFAAPARARLAHLELLVASIVGLAVDGATGVLSGSTEQSDYYGPQRPRFAKVLASLAGDRNLVRRETAPPEEPIERWPEPLLELKVAGTSFQRRPNGVSVPCATLAVDNWAAWRTRSETFLPGAGGADLLSEVKLPEDVLAFMATPAPVQVVAPTPSLVFHED